MTDANMSALTDQLSQIAGEMRALSQNGAVASYIPALAAIPADKFGLAIRFADGRALSVGDAAEPFSIQSVSKVFLLSAALDRFGEAIFERVGREATGMSFNSLILLEQEGGRPRNPLINPGAIVVSDALLAADPGWSEAFVMLLRRLSGSATLAVDEDVAASERQHGDLNRAIAWFLKAKGNLVNHPNVALESYFRACSVAMSCEELAAAGAFLIDDHGEAGGFCASRDIRRRVRAVMRTCGLYDAAGDFAYRVGLPAKSGVGGGILAVSPGRYSAAVWSPALDAKGNSVAGVAALERLVAALGG